MGDPPAAMEDLAGIYARRLPELDRHVQVGVASGRLVHVSFPETPEPDSAGEHGLLDRIAGVVAGDPDDLADVEVALTVPTDQRGVLEALRSVPVGGSVDVDALVRTTPGLDPGDDDAAATVREALRANPLPVVIPDHRVDRVEGATPGPVRRRLRTVEGIDG